MPATRKPRKRIRYVFVSGPLTSGADQLQNIRDAIEVGDILRRRGFVPFIPHLDALWHLIFPADYEEWMAWDLAWLKRCDAVIRIGGASAGADREVAYAKEHGILVVNTVQQLTDAAEVLAHTNRTPGPHPEGRSEPTRAVENTPGPGGPPTPPARSVPTPQTIPSGYPRPSEGFSRQSLHYTVDGGRHRD